MSPPVLGPRRNVGWPPAGLTGPKRRRSGNSIKKGKEQGRGAGADPVKAENHSGPGPAIWEGCAGGGSKWEHGRQPFAPSA